MYVCMYVCMYVLYVCITYILLHITTPLPQITRHVLNITPLLHSSLSLHLHGPSRLQLLSIIYCYYTVLLNAVERSVQINWKKTHCVKLFF